MQTPCSRDRFDEIVRELSDYINFHLRDYKKGEYANKVDTLANFNAGSVITGLSPLQYCWVLLTKHFLALSKQVNSGQMTWGWTTPDGKEGCQQRFADLRNYVDLAYALARLQEEVALPEREA